MVIGIAVGITPDIQIFLITGQCPVRLVAFNFTDAGPACISCLVVEGVARSGYYLGIIMGLPGEDRIPPGWIMYLRQQTCSNQRCIGLLTGIDAAGAGVRQRCIGASHGYSIIKAPVIGIV